MEIASLVLVVGLDASTSDWFSASFLHAVACTLNALLLPGLLPGRYQTSFFISFLFFWVIAFYMPVIGIFGLAFALVPPLRHIKTVQNLSIQFNEIPSLPEGWFTNNRHLRSRVIDLESLLKSKDVNRRLAAVYATLKLDDQNAIPLLKKALRDPVDDIRLLAYALIERKEQRICERIEYAKRGLEAHQGENARHLYRSIVNDYWELAHLGLVEGETLNYMLDKAEEYLEMGLQHYPDDRGLHLQYAKLLLRQGKTSPSYQEFKKAEDLGVARKKLLIYYAEINFLQRRFDDVKRYMAGLSLVAAAPNIRSTARFWQKDKFCE